MKGNCSTNITCTFSVGRSQYAIILQKISCDADVVRKCKQYTKNKNKLIHFFYSIFRIIVVSVPKVNQNNKFSRYDFYSSFIFVCLHDDFWV